MEAKKSNLMQEVLSKWESLPSKADTGDAHEQIEAPWKGFNGALRRIESEVC